MYAIGRWPARSAVCHPGYARIYAWQKPASAIQTGVPAPATKHSLAQARVLAPVMKHSLAQVRGAAPLTKHSLAQVRGAAPLTKHSLAQVRGAAPLTKHSLAQDRGPAPLTKHSLAQDRGPAPLTKHSLAQDRGPAPLPQINLPWPIAPRRDFLRNPGFAISCQEFDGAGPAALHLDEFEMSLLSTVRQSHPQAGRRRFEPMPLRAKQYSECTPRFRCKLQTPQPAIIGALQPEQYRRTDSRTQCLFGSPQSFRGARRAHHQQTIELYPLLCQRRCVRFVGRRNPDDPGRLAGGLVLALHQSR